MFALEVPSGLISCNVSQSLNLDSSLFSSENLALTIPTHFIHLSIQFISIECVLCWTNCARQWEHNAKFNSLDPWASSQCNRPKYMLLALRFYNKFKYSDIDPCNTLLT